MTTEHKCKDFEQCGNTADPQYDMDYRDVDPVNGLIHWCSACGLRWHRVEKAIYKKMDESKEFTEQFEKVVNAAHQEERKKVN